MYTKEHRPLLIRGEQEEPPKKKQSLSKKLILPVVAVFGILLISLVVYYNYPENAKQDVSSPASLLSAQYKRLSVETNEANVVEEKTIAENLKKSVQLEPAASSAVQFSRGGFPGWQNGKDQWFEVWAIENTQPAAYCGVYSTHDNDNEDRQFKWKKCWPKNIKYRSIRALQYKNSGWTGWDATWKIQCSAGYAIVKVSSFHDNGKEDRVFRFICAKFQNTEQTTCTWTGWANGWDGVLDYTCPNNRLLAGVESTHDNGKEDRRFKLYCCGYREKIVNEEPPSGGSAIAWTKNEWPGTYETGWDGRWRLLAIANGGVPGAFCGMESEHDNGREDRRFKALRCKPSDRPLAMWYTMHELLWTGWDATWTKECPEDEAIVEIQSFHDNGREDRLFKFVCAKFYRLKWGSCSWPSADPLWDNEYDKYFKFECPAGSVIAGVASRHNNGKEDRQFRFKCCSLESSATNADIPERVCVSSDGGSDEANGIYLIDQQVNLRTSWVRKDADGSKLYLFYKDSKWMITPRADSTAGKLWGCDAYGLGYTPLDDCINPNFNGRTWFITDCASCVSTVEYELNKKVVTKESVEVAYHGLFTNKEFDELSGQAFVRTITTSNSVENQVKTGVQIGVAFEKEVKFPLTPIPAGPKGVVKKELEVSYKGEWSDTTKDEWETTLTFNGQFSDCPLRSICQVFWLLKYEDYSIPWTQSIRCAEATFHSTGVTYVKEGIKTEEQREEPVPYDCPYYQLNPQCDVCTTREKCTACRYSAVLWKTRDKQLGICVEDYDCFKAGGTVYDPNRLLASWRGRYCVNPKKDPTEQCKVEVSPEQVKQGDKVTISWSNCPTTSKGKIYMTSFGILSPYKNTNKENQVGTWSFQGKSGTIRNTVINANLQDGFYNFRLFDDKYDTMISTDTFRVVVSKKVGLSTTEGGIQPLQFSSDEERLRMSTEFEKHLEMQEQKAIR